jgi:hypothetical protein
MSLNIVTLIENNPLTKLTENYKSKFIQKIQDKFSENDQQLFVASFYCYLNYNSHNDFVVNLDDIWKWLGYSRKDNAKAVLLKHFTIDTHYRVEQLAPATSGASLHGGNNKEKITMNILTFKKFCLKSQTTKADEIHDYFIKLEETLHEIINEESTELKNQLQIKDKQIDLQIKTTERERHDYFLKFFTNKPVLYILKLHTYPDGSFVIKLGESQNFVSRMSEHNRVYKQKYQKPIIIDVYEVKDHYHFEQFILHHSAIKSHILFGFETSKEHILIDSNFTYKHLQNIIDNNINQFQYITEESNSLSYKLACESRRLELKEKEILLQRQQNELLKEQVNLLKKLPQQPCIPVQVPETQVQFTIQQQEPSRNIVINNGPRVQKIDSITFDIIETFDSIIECIRQTGFSRSRLNNAVNNKNIYKDFRWNYVERDLDVNQKYDIGETNIIQNQVSGYVAQLDNNKTYIKAIYRDQKSAAKENGYLSQSPIHKSIKNGTISQNHYYQLYDDLSDELKTKYLETHPEPIFLDSNCIEKICATRNIRIELYKNKNDCVMKSRIGTATLKKYLNTGIIYNGFIYKQITV